MMEHGAVAVVVDTRDGDETSQLTLGEADTDSGREPSADDPVRVASITKTAVAIAVMQLVDDHEIDLDTPVEEYLPGVLGDRGGEVTIRHLLNHTSGLPDYSTVLYSDADAAIAVQNQTFTEDEHIAAALDQEWLDEPGAAFHYSNTNYVVLGRLIAENTSDETAAVIESDVLEPAGMTSSFFPDDAQMPDNALRGYLTRDDERIDMTEFEPSVPSWGASMVSTAPDVSLMMRALNRGDLISADSLEQMRDLGEAGYGLGLLGGSDPCGSTDLVYGQRGNWFGYNTLSLASADGERVVTVTWTGGTDDPATDPLLPASNETAVAALGSNCS